MTVPLKMLMVLLGTLLLGRPTLLCQETWIGGLAGVPSLRSGGLGIRQVGPSGNALMVALGNDSYSKDHFNGLARLDQHGNLEWLLVDSKKQYYKAAFAPMASGNALYFQGNSTSGLCSGAGTNLQEVDQVGNIVRAKFLGIQQVTTAFQLKNGDFLIYWGSVLSRLKADLSGFAWGEWFHRDPPISGLADVVDCVAENDDESLTVAGKYAAPGPDASPYYRFFVAKLKGDGSFIWYKTFQLDPSQYFLEFSSVVPISNGGYWLLGSLGYVPTVDPSSLPFLVRLDQGGDLVGQRVLCVAGNCSGGGFSSAIPTPDSGLLAVGAVNGPPPAWPSGFVMKLDFNDEPEWVKLVNDARIPPPYVSASFSEVFSFQEGYVLSTNGDAYGQPPWLYRVDGGASLSAACTDYFLQPQVTAEEIQVLVPCDDTLTTTTSTSYSFCDSAATLVKKKLLTSNTVCGVVYPLIVSAKKLVSPLKINILGWNFVANSQVLIDGAAAPATKFQGLDKKSGQTGLVIKGGSRLAKMLPKGQMVCLTVLNPDGLGSECFSFTR